MIVYPAMDLMGGRVVRLRQGRFDEATDYSADPESGLRAFAVAGAEWAHVVDLDGARAGEPVQHERIAQLARGLPLKLQVGGGVRSREHVEHLLDSGVERVVVGSVAVRAPEMVRDWIAAFGAERITLALDVRMTAAGPQVAVSGWTEVTDASLWTVADYFPGARHLLLTDIARDGELAGPNFALLDDAVNRLPQLEVQASGGVSSLVDIERLTTSGVIVGKALWEGRVQLEDAIARARA
ncbi:1-(5-phosphoribosyl)-5-[(5-phosphoribosylamino)methylideneamino] imidazole-4-carboxamide isomerase [Sphingomonas lutea]|uniref:1-(5-phosphoribosyl)-5-[(5-phosphoribosylamino)methylideneamino] imidazole-4-carboxamide isomerase n=1 Tax=Sphingomonas lutea TaxID=1045317 RepID=A0A7G9SF06_9SPHN|nr:1-(5-phosphoribosyl)-5-[(5-phosphoribosylamino)methylideneamino] imidazole-4-carboxamide isomerase [Sphingomonas lutea]QNN66431.1 1-(5-phosphoribosyl)-5-[(5-phosphoribosylamino)methylideneamino] imidazole-4-carboxamide isomerase [Sphingomonas lutea]